MDFTGALNFSGEKSGPQMGVPTLISDARPLLECIHRRMHKKPCLMVAASFCLIRPHQFWIGLMLVKFEPSTTKKLDDSWKASARFRNLANQQPYVQR